MSTVETKPAEALEVRQQQQLLAVMPNGQLDIVSMGRVLAQSGYFKDIKSLSQGIVKIMLGQELGLGPLMSIMKLYIVKENPVISANLMASRIRQSGIYDYEVLILDRQKCKIRFSRRKDGAWKVLTPDIDFTIDDAIMAQLGGWNSQYNPKKGKDFDPDSNWAKWPRNMLFARAMSDGYRFHCPDVFSMSVYTPADFDVAMDAAGEIMRDVTPQPEPSPDNLTPAQSKSSVLDRIVEQKKSESATGNGPSGGADKTTTGTSPQAAETPASAAAEKTPQSDPGDTEISDDQYTVINDALQASGLKLNDVQAFIKTLGYKKGLVRNLKQAHYEMVLAFAKGTK